MSDASDDRYQRITLRIPKELHGYLMREADARTRSMNAEIIERLEGSFRDAAGRPPKELLELVQTTLASQDRVKRQIDEVREEQAKRDKTHQKLQEDIIRIEATLNELKSSANQ